MQLLCMVWQEDMQLQFDFTITLRDQTADKFAEQKFAK
jgi:hypothetical protein